MSHSLFAKDGPVNFRKRTDCLRAYAPRYAGHLSGRHAMDGWRPAGWNLRYPAGQVSRGGSLDRDGRASQRVRRNWVLTPTTAVWQC